MKILIINFGSTSSKFAIYDGENELDRETYSYSSAEINSYKNIFDQKDLRMNSLDRYLERNCSLYKDFDCIITRGGHRHPTASGVIEINQNMIDDLLTSKWGIHAADVGVLIAYNLGKKYGIPIISADSAITDEFHELARMSGLKEISRISSLHVLNHKAVGKKFAEKNSVKYSDLNLIIAHLGGGISVAAHKKGRIIDGNNALDGDGPFSPERSGSLPVKEVIKMSFSGEYSESDMLSKVAGDGGLKSYLNTSDLREVEEMIESGDGYAKTCYESMAYQCAKSIGEMAVVLKGNVDNILLTGSIAYSKKFTNTIKEYVSWISDVTIVAGEDEIVSLADHARKYLLGIEKPINY